MSMSEFKLVDYGAKHMPERIHPEDAGMDIYAPATFHVPPHESVYVSCGFGILMPPGYMAYTVVRGSTANMGLHVAENPIDSNYTGEVHAVVWNISNDTVVIQEGERFCQLVIVPCICSARGPSTRILKKLPVVTPDEVPKTDRGAGGYGSTNAFKGDTSILYDQHGEVYETLRSDPLDHAAEVLTLKIFGKPTIKPKGDDEFKMGISGYYDAANKQVIVKCDADVITIGITARVLQKLYMETAKQLPIDMMSKVHKVVEEVFEHGQD